MRRLSLRRTQKNEPPGLEKSKSRFLEIWNAPGNLKYLSFTLKPFAKETAGFWLDNHKEQGGRYFCALEENDGISGISVIRVDPVEGFEIYGIGVRPESKRHGIGRALIKNAAGLADELGFNDIDALVFADNAVMLRLLLSLRFIPCGMEYHKRADGADLVHLKRYICVKLKSQGNNPSIEELEGINGKLFKESRYVQSV